MNKSLVTNAVAVLIIFIGFYLKDEYSFVLMTGVFVLSGIL
jgi:hypothetical protein